MAEKKPKELEKLVFCSECKYYKTYTEPSIIGTGLRVSRTVSKCTACRVVNYNPFVWWYEYPDPAFKNKNNKCTDFEPKEGR